MSLISRRALRGGWVLLGCLFAAKAACSQVEFQHADWELACDNTRSCRAVGYQPDEGDAEPLALLVERKAGPGAEPELTLMLGDAEEAALPPTVDVVVNGRSEGPVARSGQGGGLRLSRRQAGLVLRAVVGTGEVAFVADDRRWRLSSAGATAVLLRMDDAQGRVGTGAALVKKGALPESKVLPALLAPHVPVVPLVADRPGDEALGERIRPLLKATLKDPDDCIKLTSPAGEPEAIAVKRLSGSKVLLSTSCWLAAYNAGQGVWVASDKPPYAPLLVTTMATDVMGDTIDAMHKGRGLGDCWSMAQWAWNGRDFVPTYVATTGMCKMVAAGGAWALPTFVTTGRRIPGL